MSSRVANFVFPTALAVLVGCGVATKEPDASVSGAVTFNGQPVTNGTVNFSPEDGNGASAEAAIADGKYAVAKIFSGKKKVTVQGFKGQAGSTGEPLFGSNAPGATKTVEVKAGAQTIDLAVGAAKK